MVFVAPIELEIAFVMLIGGSMNAELAILIVFGLIIFREFIFLEGFGIVLRCTCGDRSRIEHDKRRVDDPHFG